ncbi:MAG: hypothetical protein ACKVQW_00955 [Pyrinomonadaceae bacterium]
MMSDLDLDRIYSFDELPKATQADLLVQFAADFEFDPNEFRLQLRIVSYAQLTEELDNVFGPNLLDFVEDDYVQSLADDILRNGLQNPPIGNEGLHRKLAHHYLERDMLRFEVFTCDN